MPSTDQATTWTALEAISEAITSSNESANLRVLLWGRDKWPHWYQQLLNQIHALAAGSPIEYITSSIQDSQIDGDDVYAFTANLAIHAQVSGLTDTAGHQNATVRTTAWSRASLTELTVIDLRPYSDEDMGSEARFPRNPTLELHYGQRPVFQLPLPRFRNNKALENLYPSLLADLVREDA
ncbi:hypothetical protein [Salinibacterium sp. TMP30]|uniref:hypothetical protein n=1 Tax=Salinibacterium sp. TMP30 TaxID=3138237 RepID=UPI003138B7CF